MSRYAALAHHAACLRRLLDPTIQTAWRRDSGNEGEEGSERASERLRERERRERQEGGAHSASQHESKIKTCLGVFSTAQIKHANPKRSPAAHINTRHETT